MKKTVIQNKKKSFPPLKNGRALSAVFSFLLSKYFF
jgi:hypothetical protein